MHTTLANNKGNVVQEPVRNYTSYDDTCLNQNHMILSPCTQYYTSAFIGKTHRASHSRGSEPSCHSSPER